MARGRKKKTVLNQKTEEPKVEAAKLLAPELESVQPMAEPVVGWVQPDIEQSTEEIIKKGMKTKIVEEPKGTVGRPDSEMISLKDSGEKLSEVLQKKEEVVTEPEEEEVVEKVDETPRPAGIRSLSKEQRNSLSRRELRYFQRTGILPK